MSPKIVRWTRVWIDGVDSIGHVLAFDKDTLEYEVALGGLVPEGDGGRWTTTRAHVTEVWSIPCPYNYALLSEYLASKLKKV